MYYQVGRKIKGLVTAVVVVCMALIVLFLIITAMQTPEAFPVMMIIGIILGLLAWIAGFFMYAYGQLVDNTDKMVKHQEIIVQQVISITEKVKLGQKQASVPTVKAEQRGS